VPSDLDVPPLPEELDPSESEALSGIPDPTAEAQVADPFPETVPSEPPSEVRWASFDEFSKGGDPDGRVESQDETPVSEPELTPADSALASSEGEASGSPPEPEPEPEPEPAAAPPVFGRSDPHERAARLARVLVSDMMTYHCERYLRALESGTLKADFEDEIQRSREEYVDRVGEDIANGSTYFRDVLNEVLARGEEIF